MRLFDWVLLSIDIDGSVFDDCSVVGKSFPRIHVNPEIDVVWEWCQCGPCLLSSDTKSSVISLEKTDWTSGMFLLVFVYQEWSMDFGSSTLETPGLVHVQ